MKSYLDVTVLTHIRSFANLEREWEDLYRHSRAATPFQSWAWLYSWWESFGEDYELQLITVRDGDFLVGIIPLMLQRRWGFGRLLFISTGDQLDLLAREGWEGKVCEAGVRALRQMGSWHVVNLTDLRPDAVAWTIFRQWHGHRSCSQLDYFLEIEVRPWEELLMSIRKSERRNARSALRRAEKDGVHCVLASRLEDAEQAAHRLVALHRELLQGRNIAREHLTRRFELFIVAAARRMTARELGGISEFWREGSVIISDFLVFGDEFTDTYLVGASQEAVQRYQWSSLFIWDALNIACNRNNAYVCLDRGVESYKQRWASRRVPCYEMILGRDPVSWSFYLTYRSLRQKARDSMRSGGISERIRKAPNKRWSDAR